MIREPRLCRGCGRFQRHEVFTAHHINLETKLDLLEGYVWACSLPCLVLVFAETIGVERAELTERLEESNA